MELVIVVPRVVLCNCMETFLTLFNTKTVHITKDVGLIPYGIKTYGFFESYITYYDEKPKVNNLEVIKLIKIKKITGKYFIDSIAFVINNAKNIDVLNLYHISLQTLLQLLVYKMKNKSGKVYIKLDGGKYKHNVSLFKRPFYKLCYKNANLISSEIPEISKKLSSDWNTKILHIQNPYNPLDLLSVIEVAKKENIILCVGRIGTYEKASEIILDAFSLAINSIDKDWKLFMVGPIENENFNQYIEKFKEDHSEVFERIKFFGNIDDRNYINEIYSKSKIFVSASRLESFGIALLEAELHCCYPIVTNLASHRYITNNFANASVFEINDVNALSNIIIDICNKNKNFFIEKTTVNKTYALDEFSLQKIVTKIYNSLDYIEQYNKIKL